MAVPNTIIMNKQPQASNPFVERLIVEKRELDEKIEKLKAFIEGENFSGIDGIQQSLLKIQLPNMTAYSNCLGERLAYLGITVTA